jgi:hypothetical protein
MLAVENVIADDAVSDGIAALQEHSATGPLSSEHFPA